ncbi:MAG: NAD-dependent epimerase/dehydratase family protein [Betaproteobacteria bacterium]|nr:NAD-dependent epimerase/dehydratase family protein [Betaproteobacteria bacterium]
MYSSAEQSPSGTANVLVFGARSQVGYLLLPALVRKGHRVLALYRQHRSRSGDDAPGITWKRYSPDNLADVLRSESGLQRAIHLAPLNALPELLPALAGAGVCRLIAFGSTSTAYKQASGDHAERDLITRIAAAERELAERCAQLGIQWTLFRPTLTYGRGMDGNVAFIARFIRRFGFFPLVGAGTGLRQPVHAEDLSQACLLALDNSGTHGKTYDLSGGSTLAYREMVAEIFRALGRKPRMPEIPLSVYRAALKTVRLLPGLRYLSPEMADRMNRDLCFDHAAATRDFGYRPRPFTLDELALRGHGD